MMKKIFFVLAVIYSSHDLFAQKKFQGGLMAGLATSQMSGDGLAGWNKFGFAGGGWVRADFSEKWSATLGMQYINKGSRTKQDTINYNTFAYKLNYIEVPLALGYKLGHFRFNIGAGAAFLITQKITANGYDYPATPEFRKYDITGSAGLTFLLGEFWALDLKASTSVIPIRPSPNFANKLSFYEKGNYNQVIQFMILKGF